MDERSELEKVQDAWHSAKNLSIPPYPDCVRVPVPQELEIIADDGQKPAPGGIEVVDVYRDRLHMEPDHWCERTIWRGPDGGKYIAGGMTKRMFARQHGKPINYEPAELLLSGMSDLGE